MSTVDWCGRKGSWHVYYSCLRSPFHQKHLCFILCTECATMELETTALIVHPQPVGRKGTIPLDTKHALGTTTIDSIKKQQRRRWRKWGCGRQWKRATAAVTAMMMAGAAAAGAMAAAAVVANEMANAKQPDVTAAKKQQSFINKQKNGSKDDGRSVAVAISGEQQCGDGCGGSQGNGGG